MVIDHLRPTPGLPIVLVPSLFGSTPGVPAPAAFFLVVADGVLWLVAAAAFMMPGSTAGVGLDFGRICFGTPPPTLGTLGFLLFGSVAFFLFPCTLCPPLGPACLLFLLSTCLVFFLLSPPPLATRLVLGTTGLLSGLFCRSPFSGFFISSPCTAGGTAGFRVCILAPSTCFVICCLVRSTTAGL